MTICLTMIVKDEAHIIGRCLALVRSQIDYWIIVDTGSTDGTEAAAREALAGIPGEYHHASWHGFGPARTRAMELADGKADYAWVVDADDIWSGTIGPLTEDAHSVWLVRETEQFSTVRFLKLGCGWRYEGLVHEQPVNDKPLTNRPFIEGLTVSSPNDGASWADPEKFRKHAEVFEAALLESPGDTRSAFYLAQSWRDHGDMAKAAACYLARAEMGAGNYWEEIYVSYLEAGRALLRLGRITDGRDALLKAHATYPARREAPAELCRVFAILAAVMPTCGTLNVQRVLGEEAVA